ncbi:MAG: X-Pro aminopeptidase [Gammaproteobacteria bacterium]|nr:X-Pro aminopeptidase [Gammaproteobacteria bacterium]OUV67987.1 MAG: X-Pro aminopeptidase [Gammaproteobacteria bacterium TMED133]
MHNIEERLILVRQQMADSGIQAIFVPTTDEYLGEYVPEQNQRLRWISGFSGSAGLVIILKKKAALFVDGRYTIQAKQQTSCDFYEHCHLSEKLPIDWLLENLQEGSVGVDSRLHSFNWYRTISNRCEAAGLSLIEIPSNPIDKNWTNRPTTKKAIITLLSEQYTGVHSQKKRELIGKEISKKGAEVALITQLDSIAWLLNIRGKDIPRLPVLLSTATLTTDGKMILFTDPSKIPDNFFEHVGTNVTIKKEDQIEATLSSFSKLKVLGDPGNTNAFTFLRCMEASATIIEDEDPVALTKAQKNPIELQGMRNCHVRDGSAVIRFLAWLEREVAEGKLHDEGILAEKLFSFRNDLDHFHDLSFDTISAAGPNSAICHYNHLNGTPAELSLGSLYLVDSGGQFSDGTTDITRTVAIGEPSNEQKRMFTLVLKGHIALSQAIFPKGTCGAQLDVLARQFLWQVGADYDHGTGHGVGCFLSVHEGPQRISKGIPSQALLPGMVLSNEPGFYQEDDFGIRCENLMAVCELENGMLAFETITFAPFDLSLIEIGLMTETEIAWLNQYHEKVQYKLSSCLNTEDNNWLMEATQRIKSKR